VLVLNAGAAGRPPGTADGLVEWSQYRRLADLPVEAMRAHFVRHVYDRHSHDAYLLGVTERGVQAFRCRGSTRASAAGMIMAFNPDDPHDGHAAARGGFTYAMLHVGTDLVADILADTQGRRVGLPLFTEPVVDDGPLAGRLLRLNALLLDGATRLEAQELVMGAVLALVQRHATQPVAAPTPSEGGALWRVRDLLHDRFADDLSADDLAGAVGLSRFQLYRQFRERYGVAPSAYLRQVRLREARRRLATGAAIAEVAFATGFADQSHLTRWFRRTYGITPGVYQLGGSVPAHRPPVEKRPTRGVQDRWSS
jgi:AraC-like DNA-binding protein